MVHTNVSSLIREKIKLPSEEYQDQLKNILPIGMIATRPPTKIAAALKVTSATKKQSPITSATKKQSTISKSTISKTRYFLKKISPLINLSNKKETKPLQTIEYLLKTIRKHVLIEKCCWKKSNVLYKTTLIYKQITLKQTDEGTGNDRDIVCKRNC